MLSAIFFVAVFDLFWIKMFDIIQLLKLIKHFVLSKHNFREIC